MTSSFAPAALGTLATSTGTRGSNPPPNERHCVNSSTLISDHQQRDQIQLAIRLGVEQTTTQVSFVSTDLRHVVVHLYHPRYNHNQSPT